MRDSGFHLRRRARACGGRAGHVTVLLVGDPVETITMSSIDTGWCFVRSDSCRSATRTVQIAAR